MSRPAQALALGLSLLLLNGCATRSEQSDLEEADEVYRLEGDLRQREDYYTRWKLASACLDVVDHPRVAAGVKLDFARRALAHAEAAVALEPERVEGHYYHAVCLGRVLEHATLPDIGDIGELEAAGLRARELDPSFKCAGPLRLLAILYHKAPPWPLGPELAGEEDEIEELFAEAIERVPDCPENRVCYAEFLVDVERAEEAAEQARAARGILERRAHLDPVLREDLETRVRILLGEPSPGAK